MSANHTNDPNRPQAAGQALATSEARNRAMLEAAVDAIICIDAEGIIQMINPAVERLFGYEAAEVIGQNVKVLMPSPYHEEHDGYLERYLHTGEKRIIGIGREATARRKDGRVFPIDLSVAEANVGSTRLFMGIIRDITDRKRAEKALNEKNEDLQRAVSELQAKNEEIRSMTQQLWQAAKLASVGELAASIAHELNNPLATIMLRVESLLGKLPPDDSRRRPLEIVDQEAKRMSELVANLLQFCHRSAERSSTVDVGKEVINTLELIYHQLRKRQIMVAPEIDPTTPMIIADRQKLRQVFLNLLTNASDAMPNGGRLILRSAPAQMTRGQPGVVLEFTDTGAGIAAQHLDRVMEPFFSTKEEGKGTGLGLAICRRIIQEHKGTIQIISEVGKGTTVRIVLPIRNGVNASELASR
jgi:PAS domain S-box-containing protein